MSLAIAFDRARVPTRIGFLVVLLAATLLGLEPEFSVSAIAMRARRAFDLSVSGTAMIDAAQNLLLFAGWGLTWMATAPAGGSLRALRGALLSGAAISFTVEAAQLLSPRRVASVVDLATNSAGAMAGALVMVLLVRTAAGMNSGRRHRLPNSLLAIPLVLAALLEAVVPLFRHELLPSAHGWPWARSGAVLAEFEFASITHVPWSDAPLFFLTGIAAGLAITGVGARGRAEARLLLYGVAAASVAEFLHAPLGYQIVLGAVLIHVGAWSAGVLSARSLSAEPRWLGLMVGVVLAWLIRPFQFSASPGELLPLWWLPLGMHGQSVDIWGMADVVATFLIYLPLGAYLAVRPVRTRGLLGGVLPAVYLAILAETAQLFVVARTPDGTDLLVAIGGVLIAWVVTRRAGFEPAPTVLV